jgi:hypothetical protein
MLVRKRDLRPRQHFAHLSTETAGQPAVDGMSPLGVFRRRAKRTPDDEPSPECLA